MFGEILINIACVMALLVSVIGLFFIIFFCAWTLISMNYQPLRAMRNVIVENANGQMGWTNPLHGNEIEQIRLNSVRQVLSHGAYQNLQEMLFVDRLSQMNEDIRYV
jgi:hypothetical protein